MLIMMIVTIMVMILMVRKAGLSSSRYIVDYEVASGR